MIIKNITWNEDDVENAQSEGDSLPETVTIKSQDTKNMDWDNYDSDYECVSAYLDDEYGYEPTDFDIEWEKEDGNVYEVTVTDTATYRIRATSEDSARDKAWDYFNEREPDFDIKVVDEPADNEI